MTSLAPSGPQLVYRLWPKQREAMQLLGLVPGGPDPPVQELLYGGEAGPGKLLSVATPIPTPNGWRELRDVSPGDTVFGQDGRPCAVLAESETMWASAYRLSFDDGAEIIAHDDHLWLTFDHAELGKLLTHRDEWRNRRREERSSRVGGKKSALFTETIQARNRLSPPLCKPAPTGTVRTTSELVATLKTSGGRTNHAIPVAAALVTESVPLPLDPYLLGAWLGDGTTTAGQVTTADPEVIEAFKAAGYKIGYVGSKSGNLASTYNVLGLRRVLRELGVLGNKHVPDCYLWASESQREALLQGLLDTDGGAEKGYVGFTSTKQKLTEGVAQLARSLGMKCRVHERRAKLRGVDYGPKWQVLFTANRRVFRLERKAQATRIAARQTTRFHYLLGAERVEPTLMKCLKVAADDGLFLAGRSMIPTHNSFLVRALASYLCMDYWPGCVGVLFRKSYPDLRDNHIINFLKELPPGMARYNATDHEFTFMNGSILQLRYCDTEMDAYTHYQGPEWAFLLVDEATQFTPNMLTWLRSRCRWPADKPLGKNPWHQLIVYCANPGGVGHAYFKGQFIDAAPAGEVFPAIDVEPPATPWPRCFLRAKLSDNPSLDYAEQRARLQGIADPVMRKAVSEGDWNIFFGQMFTSWQPRVHVCRPFEVPWEWQTRWGSIDYGFSAPMAAYWHVQVPAGESLPVEAPWARTAGRARILTYRELYQNRLTTDVQAITLRNLSYDGERHQYEPVRIWRASPDMWNRERDGGSVARDYQEMWGGLPWRLTPANNDRLAGWARMHRALAWSEDREYPPEWVVMESCRNLIRTLPSLPRDEHNPEDVSQKESIDDHGAESCLVAGTLVETARGPVPIEAVQAGDLVRTRAGYRSVLRSWRTQGAAQVLRVCFSDGGSLVGTPDHRVYVSNRGYTPLRFLKQGDMLLSRQQIEAGGGEWWEQGAQWTRWYSWACATEDILSHRTGLSAAISLRVLRTMQKVLGTCIGIFGGLHTDRFRPDGTSTISTETRSTTTSRIWSAYRRRVIGIDIRSHLGSWRMRGLASPPLDYSATLGERLPRAALGTKSMESVAGRSERRILVTATNVGSALLEWPSPWDGSARTPASRGGGGLPDSIMWNDRAKSAVCGLPQTDTASNAPAPIRVEGVSAAGSAAVYNLHVDGLMEYVAGGVLSLNCRYALLGERAATLKAPRKRGYQITAKPKEKESDLWAELTGGARSRSVREDDW